MGRSRSQCCGIQALDISNTIRTCIVSMIVRMVCTSCCISCTARTLACAANLHRFKTKQWTSAREHGGRSEGGWDAATPFPQSSVELLQLSRSTAQQLPRSLLRCSYAGLCSCDQETGGESAQLYRAQSGLPKTVLLRNGSGGWRRWVRSRLQVVKGRQEGASAGVQLSRQRRLGGQHRQAGAGHHVAAVLPGPQQAGGASMAAEPAVSSVLQRAERTEEK